MSHVRYSTRFGRRREKEGKTVHVEIRLSLMEGEAIKEQLQSPCGEWREASESRLRLVAGRPVPVARWFRCAVGCAALRPDRRLRRPTPRALGRRVSRLEDFHPRPLAKRCMNLSMLPSGERLPAWSSVTLPNVPRFIKKDNLNVAYPHTRAN